MMRARYRNVEKLNGVHIPLTTGKADSSKEGSISSFGVEVNYFVCLAFCRLFVVITWGDCVLQLFVSLHHLILKL